MSGFSEQDLMQFWKDANSYQSIDVPCFNIDEFKDDWVRDKTGHEPVLPINDVTTAGTKQLNLSDAIANLLKSTNADMLRIGKYYDGEIFAYKLTESRDYYEPFDEEEIKIS